MARKPKNINELLKPIPKDAGYPNAAQSTYSTVNDKLPGVDYDLSLYDLTDLFYNDYAYHNNSCLWGANAISSVNVSQGTIQQQMLPLSRFQAFRRMEACRLGSRPFSAQDNVALHKPNMSLGHYSMILTYQALPFKSVLTNNDYVKIITDRRLYNRTKLSEEELETLRLNEQDTPALTNNWEIGDTVSDAFNRTLKISKHVQKTLDYVARHYPQEAFVALLHENTDLEPQYIAALDLVTEPLCDWDPATWNHFFVIRRMSVSEITHIINGPDETFWDKDALRWALESALNNECLINYQNHYNFQDFEQGAGENFMVRSFYRQKNRRLTNIGAYYGNLLVVEGYYLNKDEKVNKVIFFPSATFYQISEKDRSIREQFSQGKRTDDRKVNAQLKALKGANILFFREDIQDSMTDTLTIIPWDRAEKTLERQRGPGFELLAPIELLMRFEVNIFNMAQTMGTVLFQNLNEGDNSETSEDIEIDLTGDWQDIGERKLITLPWNTNLKDLLAVRSILLQHIMAKCFLGGLDGLEQFTDGRGAQLANLRLIRDARVHKHTMEDFSKGLTEFFTHLFYSVNWIF